MRLWRGPEDGLATGDDVGEWVLVKLPPPWGEMLATIQRMIREESGEQPTLDEVARECIESVHQGYVEHAHMSQEMRRWLAGLTR